MLLGMTFQWKIPKKLETHYERYQSYIKSKLYPIFAKYKFFSKAQHEETLDSFVTCLRLLARDCNSPNLDEMIRDRIVFGTNSAKIREKLINVGEILTMDKAVQIVQSYEYSQKQFSLLTE